MADELWGLCLGRSVRDTPGGGVSEDLAGLSQSCEGDLWLPWRVAEAMSALTGGTVASRRIGPMAVDGRPPAGVVGVRCLEGDAVGSSADHEVSSARGGRADDGCGKMPRTTIVPPQHGQRSGGCAGRRSWTWLPDGEATSSRLRQSASFAARWPLARKP